MKLTEEQTYVIKELLAVEHSAIANQLGFISESYNIIDENLLNKTVGLLDTFSRVDNERARKIVITLSAILWTYRKEEWEGLKDFLILTLSRTGFSPSAIMLDTDYDFEDSSFSGSSSLINELNVTIHQLKHEIQIQDTKFLLTGFQMKVWDKLNNLKLLGISAPTSAGKSFVILLKAIESIIKIGGNVIYIVPTLSLVSQVCEDFHKQIKHFKLSNCKVATTYNSQELNGNKIYVLTQEKAISAFSQSENPFENISVLIVDEIQNIERVSNDDDQRAKTLYDTLMEFRHRCNPILTIISGPRVDGLRQLGIDIFDEQLADEEKVKDSPVASFTYSISQSKDRYFFNQYSDILTVHNKIPISTNNFIEGYGKSQYRENFLNYLSYFVNKLGTDSRNIIFSPNPSQARKTAIRLSQLNDNSLSDFKVLSLVNYLKETVHDNYDMCETIPKGFVYHHGKTPSHVRAVVERAVKDKLIPNVVCTTTLMQGVNLPAQNVILRNPYLAINKINGTKPKLTDYEISNLRGRAGRLLKDFIGRTFVLEENSFIPEAEQPELFSETEKILHSGYGEKYNSFKKEIHASLEHNIPSSLSDKEFAFLTTHIRQTVLRYSRNSYQRLISTGIDVSEEQIERILQNLSVLTVPKDVCYKNRYWDPIDLDQLYLDRKSYVLPTSVNENQIESSLCLVLLKMQTEFQSYYNKYLGLDINLLESACISAKDWMKEKSLKKILDDKYFATSDKIEDRISLLQGKISYGIPMLLKPLYDMNDPENMFLRFIEIGAYKPITRKMIEMNIPRETAIYLNDKLFSGMQNQRENLEDLINVTLSNNLDSIDYWRLVQIQGII
jgi:hypothetical protein